MCLSKHSQSMDSRLDKSPLTFSPARASLEAEEKAICTLYVNHISILNGRKDLALLLSGLRCLSILRRVTIIGGPSRLPGSRWLFSHGPHAWDHAGTGVEARYWSGQVNFDRRNPEWDKRGIEHLLQALCATKKRLTELHIGNSDRNSITHDPLRISRVHERGLPLDLTYPQTLESLSNLGQATRIESMPEIKSLLCCLTALSLHIDAFPMFYRQMCTERHLGPLFSLLTNTRHIQRLSLSVTHLLAANVTKIILSNTWNSLVTFKIRNMMVHPDDLREFLIRHQTTQKKLYLRHVTWDDICAIRKWKAFFDSNNLLLELEDAIFELIECEPGRMLKTYYIRKAGLSKWSWIELPIDQVLALAHSGSFP